MPFGSMNAGRAAVPIRGSHRKGGGSTHNKSTVVSGRPSVLGRNPPPPVGGYDVGRRSRPFERLACIRRARIIIEDEFSKVTPERIAVIGVRIQTIPPRWGS